MLPILPVTALGGLDIGLCRVCLLMSLLNAAGSIERTRSALSLVLTWGLALYIIFLLFLKLVAWSIVCYGTMFICAPKPI